MSDLPERLRRLYAWNGTNHVQEAADEIERLRAEVDALRADARRWRFSRDNNLTYFVPTKHWRLTNADGNVVAEGFAENYEVAIDAALSQAKEAQ